MTDAFQRVIGSFVEPVRRVADRWKYALPDPVMPDAARCDAALGLGAAGDWCGRPPHKPSPRVIRAKNGAREGSVLLLMIRSSAYGVPPAPLFFPFVAT
jgi:hypothetical protein